MKKGRKWRERATDRLGDKKGKRDARQIDEEETEKQKETRKDKQTRKQGENGEWKTRVKHSSKNE